MACSTQVLAACFWFVDLPLLSTVHTLWYSCSGFLYHLVLKVFWLSIKLLDMNSAADVTISSHNINSLGLGGIGRMENWRCVLQFTTHTQDTQRNEIDRDLGRPFPIFMDYSNLIPFSDGWTSFTKPYSLGIDTLLYTCL